MSLEVITDKCPVYASFFGFAGSTAAIVFASVGAAYGTAKAGSGIAGMGQAKPQMIMKSLVPVVMASIVGIYGLVVAILIGSAVTAGPEYNLHSASIHLASGLATGFGGLASGWTIGVVGDAGVRCLAQQTRIFVAMVLILIFAEVLGLYGLIVALILNSKTSIGASCT